MSARERQRVVARKGEALPLTGCPSPARARTTASAVVCGRPLPPGEAIERRDINSQNPPIAPPQPPVSQPLPQNSPLKTRPGPNPCQTLPHPVDGEGVGSTLLDDGGLWPSDEAGERHISGGLAGRGRIPPACSPRAFGSRPLSAPTGTSAPCPARQRTRRRVAKARTGPAGDGRVENGHAGRCVASKRFFYPAPGVTRSPRARPDRPVPAERGRPLPGDLRDAAVWKASDAVPICRAHDQFLALETTP